MVLRKGLLLCPSAQEEVLSHRHQQKEVRGSLCFQSVSNARLEMGKLAFWIYAAPAAWNLLQNDLVLGELVTLSVF